MADEQYSKLVRRVQSSSCLVDFKAAVPLLTRVLFRDSARVAAAPGQAHVWDRCRAAAPRVARTSGVVLDRAGRQCRNTAAVDEAMRSTRAFWQEAPVSWDDQ